MKHTLALSSALVSAAAVTLMIAAPALADDHLDLSNPGPGTDVCAQAIAEHNVVVTQDAVDAALAAQVRAQADVDAAIAADNEAGAEVDSEVTVEAKAALVLATETLVAAEANRDADLAVAVRASDLDYTDPEVLESLGDTLATIRLDCTLPDDAEEPVEEPVITPLPDGTVDEGDLNVGLGTDIDLDIDLDTGLGTGTNSSGQVRVIPRGAPNTGGGPA